MTELFSLSNTKIFFSTRKLKYVFNYVLKNINQTSNALVYQ